VDPEFDAEELRTGDGSLDRGRATGSRRSQGSAFVVTSARPGHTEEMSGRLRRYLISMTIRVVFLVLAIFVFSGWLRIAAAVVLPWIAVVMANAGPTDSEDAPTFITADRLAIDGPPTTQIGSAAERPR
jgi:ABC-type transport system involved in cytochrome c biogenesis permease subunit